MSLVNVIVGFVTDKTKRMSVRAAAVIAIIGLIVLADNITGFTYYYPLQQKLNCLQEVSEVLKDSSLSPADRMQMHSVRHELLAHRSWKEMLSNYITTYSWHTESKHDKKVDTGGGNRKFTHLITSTWLWLFVLAICPFVALTEKDETLAGKILILIAVEVLFLICAWLSWFLLGLIPQISKESPNINYVINVVVNFIFMVFFMWYGNRKPKENKIK